MTMTGDRYILAGKHDHDRLRVISEIHDGRTRELLARAGLTQGHRFVEFGCGLGYVTRKGGEFGGPIAKNHGTEGMEALYAELGLGAAALASSPASWEPCSTSQACGAASAA